MLARAPKRGLDLTDPVRRALDVAIGAAALLMVAPILVVVAGIIRLDRQGPAVFRQERLGQYGRPFTIYKLRTMRTEDDAEHRRLIAEQLGRLPPAEARANSIQKLTGDRRITPIGRLLRRTSIDELPQLINVLRGEMAVVGPRPVLPWEAAMFSDAHAARFAVKPGLTGLWQVSGRGELSMLQALDLDVEYVAKRSLALDLRILLRTPGALLRIHQTG